MTSISVGSASRSRFGGEFTRGAGRLVTFSCALAWLAACSAFDTDISNPNAVSEDALGDPAGATALANGLGGAVTRSLTSVEGPYAMVGDELTWSGSREHWKLLDEGDTSDPTNEYTNAAYPGVSEARWLSKYTLGKLEAWDAAGTLRVRTDLVRAYVYAATIHTVIGEMYDDFVLGSDRTSNAAPVGETNMTVAFDSALTYIGRGLTLTRALKNTDFERQLLGLSARVKFSKAVWLKLKPSRTTPASPYVNDAGANADATAALALMGSTYRYRVTPTVSNTGANNFGSEMNSRNEIRAGSEYVNTDAAQRVPLAGLAGIKLKDPIINAPDPVLAKTIDECCRLAAGTQIGITLTSSKEMRLILAEAALAQGNTAEVRTQINATRGEDALPAWDGVTPAPRDMLLHERRVTLFLQGRRLHDLYRFGLTADRWLPGSIAAKKACFFPVAFIERQSNLLAQQPAIARPPYCS